MEILALTVRDCERFADGLGVTASSAPLFAFRLLRMDAVAKPPSAGSVQMDFASALELSLLASGENARAMVERAARVSKGTAAFDARLAFARARSVFETSSTFVSLEDALTSLTHAGAAADILFAFLQNDLRLGELNRTADRLRALDAADAWAARNTRTGSIAIAALHNRRAVALEVAGRLDEAVEVNQVAIEEYRLQLGFNHPSVRRGRSNIAVILERQGRHEEALAAQRAVLKDHEAAHDDPAGTAISHEAIARVLLTLGKQAEAEEHCQKAIAIHRAELPPNDGGAARGEQCLAAVRRNRW